ncbi:non-lysosomal glucosylceramidase [Trichogramma pretiosum]|uniref:non-lysosomal glucosylceramidase n=1 Tax=Trichogramma pretiosum TaxID=7493 RepID=UPI0006C9ADE6|nr:non-lysosomal glucosylceramidase [Trichogramma pretiosum]
MESEKMENKEMESKEVESKDVESKEVESKEVESNEVESKEVDSKEVESKEVESKEVENQEMENKEMESETKESKIDTMIPKYGFKVKLNHEFPEKWSQNMRPSFMQTVHMLPLFWRYLWYYQSMKRKNRPVIMDYMTVQHGQQIYGVPIGGIGGGSIGRGFKGEFCRYSIQPGIYNYTVMPANQFIVTISDASGKVVYNQVLSTNKNPQNLKSWKWGYDGSRAEYTGLFPRAWTYYTFEDKKLEGLGLICRQVSPVMPGEYRDSSLPCAVFVWDVINDTNNDYKVAITFTFQSGCGSKDDSKGEKWTEFFQAKNQARGCLIHQEIHDMPCTYAISSRANGSDVHLGRHLKFDPISSGCKIWDDLQNEGRLEDDNHDDNAVSEKTKKPVAVAVGAQVLAKAHDVAQLEFCLVWDMPKIQFYNKQVTHERYYTQFFNSNEEGSEKAAVTISGYALMNYKRWEETISSWQSEVLDDPQLPKWYKSALFNELYYVVDGGTIWLKPEPKQFPETDPRSKYGRFAYLEGHEYRMYNTYDVHFYAAFALAQLWPELEASIQYEFRDCIFKENKATFKQLINGVKCPRKVKGAVPHDIGDPAEEPFELINAYNVHDISNWRDLNPKFVLGCYRLYHFNKNLDQLREFWEAIEQVMEHCMTFDVEEDGLIQHAGFPDQTYDCWQMTGVSAYCGGLWLAALQCCVKMAQLLGEGTKEARYKDILDRAAPAFHAKLWNGLYYNFDCSKGSHRETIMSDQLCGHWLLRACGFEYEVFPKLNVHCSLLKIYNYNVMKYKKGTRGAVNGFMPNGGVDRSCVQSEEMWTGVAYSLAALMIHENMVSEAFKVAEGVYTTVYEKIGLGFETPEALAENNVYRSIGYMRPLSIWAMQHAWNNRKKMLEKEMKKKTQQPE